MEVIKTNRALFFTMVAQSQDTEITVPNSTFGAIVLNLN